KTIDRAIAVRSKLDKAVTGRRLTQAQARGAIAALDGEIHNLVDLDIQSSEGSLLHETKLRSHLAYLAADVDLAYARPTRAQYAVFEELRRESLTGERKLQAAIAEGRRLLR
ncbi:MAG: hypothetical protein ACYDDQ_11705, partial [Vulcanimicrobiaceae bacterium]